MGTTTYEPRGCWICGSPSEGFFCSKHEDPNGGDGEDD